METQLLLKQLQMSHPKVYPYEVGALLAERRRGLAGGVQLEEAPGELILKRFCHVSFHVRKVDAFLILLFRFAEVESSFRAADPATNTMQVKRPAPADGSTSGDISDEASKRAKLDDQKGGQDQQ